MSKFLDRERFVRIKRLHDDLGVNTAKARVTVAKHNLVMLVILVKNMLISAVGTKVITAVRVNAAGTKITTAQGLRLLKDKDFL
ncbi:hypothetical protein Tco_0781669 [Tanacetum coccineum]